MIRQPSHERYVSIDFEVFFLTEKYERKRVFSRLTFTTILFLSVNYFSYFFHKIFFIWHRSSNQRVIHKWTFLSICTHVWVSRMRHFEWKSRRRKKSHAQEYSREKVRTKLIFWSTRREREKAKETKNDNGNETGDSGDEIQYKEVRWNVDTPQFLSTLRNVLCWYRWVGHQRLKTLRSSQWRLLRNKTCEPRWTGWRNPTINEISGNA